MGRIPTVLVCALAATGCSEPFVTIPGGELPGQVLDPPDVWTEVPDTIQLETRPADPYSINIWSVGVGQDLYVATGADGTAWTEFIEQDPSVRVRFGDDLYRLRAAVVDEADARSQVVQAYAAKYEVDPQDGWVAEGMIIRLNRP